MRARIIEGAHGKAKEPREPQVLQDYERGEDSPLSDREREVLQLAADGLSSEEISGKLFFAGETVKTHLCNIYLKLHVYGKKVPRPAAVAIALRRGWIQ